MHYLSDQNYFDLKTSYKNSGKQLFKKLVFKKGYLTKFFN